MWQVIPMPEILLGDGLLMDIPVKPCANSIPREIMHGYYLYDLLHAGVSLIARTRASALPLNRIY
jgi:hypothetical protein